MGGKEDKMVEKSKKYVVVKARAEEATLHRDYQVGDHNSPLVRFYLVPDIFEFEGDEGLRRQPIPLTEEQYSELLVQYRGLKSYSDGIHPRFLVKMNLEVSVRD